MYRLFSQKPIILWLELMLSIIPIHNSYNSIFQLRRSLSPISILIIILILHVGTIDTDSVLLDIHIIWKNKIFAMMFALQSTLQIMMIAFVKHVIKLV